MFLYPFPNSQRDFHIFKGHWRASNSPRSHKCSRVMADPGLAVRLKQACLSFIMVFSEIAGGVLLKNIWPNRQDFQPGVNID